MNKKVILSKKALIFIGKNDITLNKKLGYNANNISTYINNLLDFGKVEVGYRSSCGITDATMFTWYVWIKLIKLLTKEGLCIDQQIVEHDNSYATISGGFWNSTIFTLQHH